MKLEEELIGLIEEEFEVYIDECDLDEDRWIDPQDFANHAKQIIEHNHGKLKFDDFNIESYAQSYIETKGE
jgi:hypothetical protein